MKVLILLVGSLIVGYAVATFYKTGDTMSNDKNYNWLEDIQGEKALAWVNEKNQSTLKTLTNEALYQTLEKELRPIMFAEDRLILGQIRHGYLYNFWQDQTHKRGIWRRIAVDQFSTDSASWQLLLDLDALAESEKENWVWGGVNCLNKKPEMCLVYLSRGGKDAFVAREFNINTRAFVVDGFYLPEAKSRVSWLDQDNLLIGTDWGSDSMTTSGYPREIRMWQRGHDWKDAALILRGEAGDVSLMSYPLHHQDQKVQVIQRNFDFFSSKKWFYDRASGLRPINVPDSARIQGFAFNHLLATIQEPLVIDDKEVTKGSLIAWPIHNILSPAVLFEPNELQSSGNVSITADAVIVSALEKVQGRLFAFNFDQDSNEWTKNVIEVADASTLTLYSNDSDSRHTLLTIESFTEPTTSYLLESSNAQFKLRRLQQGVTRFESDSLSTTQYWATSKDGTKIPYFVIARSDVKLTGDNPTLLTGYGGFLISRTPNYLPHMGKGWLEKGGVYVLANIRGGAEFGPRWHQAALKENRQRAFNDFIAVAEDLTERGITSAKHLGISGGSNGGLLVGAVTMQRPELFNAVICMVPLLDMLRFHKLLAGASWVAEYGSPDDEKMRDYLQSYSPFHNVKENQTYPEIFFLTSTLDDRVHPGHARKMAAKMLDLGHSVYYYENTEGGHGAAANIEQRLKMQALMLTYLWRKLRPDNLN